MALCVHQTSGNEILVSDRISICKHVLGTVYACAASTDTRIPTSMTESNKNIITEADIKAEGSLSNKLLKMLVAQGFPRFPIESVHTQYQVTEKRCRQQKKTLKITCDPHCLDTVHTWFTASPLALSSLFSGSVLQSLHCLLWAVYSSWGGGGQTVFAFVWASHGTLTGRRQANARCLEPTSRNTDNSRDVFSGRPSTWEQLDKQNIMVFCCAFFSLVDRSTSFRLLASIPSHIFPPVPLKSW